MRLTALLAVALTLVVPAPVLGDDGAVEINQALALAGGVTPGDGAGFPVTLSAPGRYFLSSDLDLTSLTVPENASAINVTADHVEIDLRGFSLVGASVCTGMGNGVGPNGIQCTLSGSGVGVDGSAVSASHTRIRNGRVTGMGSRGLRLGSGAVVEEVDVSHSPVGGILCGDDCTVRSCRVYLTDSNGVTIGHRSRVLDSLIWDNTTFGIEAAGKAGNLIRGNVLLRHGNTHVTTGNAALVENVLRDAANPPTLSVDSGVAHNVQSGAGSTSTAGVRMGLNACAGGLCP